MARYRNLFDPNLIRNQKIQFNNIYLVQGNSFKLIQKQRGDVNKSVEMHDSKIVGTTLPNETNSSHEKHNRNTNLI